MRTKLLAVFATEADEHLDAIAKGLLALEQLPSAERRQELVETTFREVHTLKGAARAVNLDGVVALCHALESVFAALKRGRIAPAPELLDLLHQGFALAKEILRRRDDAAAPERSPALEPLIDRLAAAATGLAEAPELEVAPPREPDRTIGATDRAPSAAPTPAPGPANVQPTASRPAIRISTAKLDALLHHAEELVSAKLAAARHAADIGRLAAEVAGRSKVRERRRQRVGAVRSALARGAAPGNGVDAASLLELVEEDGRALRALAAQLSGHATAVRQELRSLTKMVDGLLESAKQVLMVPVSTLLDPLPPLVRELARDQGKDIALAISGDDLEIDRRVQEEMKDALLHLVRNAVDHGIEAPAERTRKGKPMQGTVAIAVARHASGKAEITIADDGAGIDVAEIRSVAQKLGMMSAEQAAALGDTEALTTIFRSGFSTSAQLTDISGRGLGLAIVEEKVEKLGGTIAIESRPDAGTTFRLILPITLASFRGVFVEIDDATFILPTSHVERVIRVPAQEIATVEGRETIQIGGRTIGLVWLRRVLELPERAAPPLGHRNVVILTWAGARIAFVVDAIRDEQEVLMKGLGRQLARVRNVAGATVLATGALALILNVPDLMKSAATGAPVARPGGAPAPAAATRQSILVAEDSITARTLFKNILEAAGYRVKTAVDGHDAWTTLRTEAFDLVVSDVEMPGMGGFDLTARIRSDATLGDLPVILVTSRGSREDREQGIDAGANAYIVKGAFDQKQLLDIIGRLI